jgi:two-component system sensor histidine kinase MtrB
VVLATSFKGNRKMAIPFRPSLRLRARLTLAFGLGALLLTTVPSVLTYLLVRDNLLETREQSALSVATVNANQAQRRIIEEIDAGTTRDLLSNLRGVRAESTPAIRLDTEWISADPVVFEAPGNINAELLDLVSASDYQGAQMTYRLANGTPVLVVGFPLTTRNALYFEATPLDDIEDTLGTLSQILIATSAAICLLGIAIGGFASRRLLLPVEKVGQAARAIATGDLTARLEVSRDRDLEQLTDSFNQMATNLEKRIQSDAKFASNVSHELRSPLTTIMASVEVLNANHLEFDQPSTVALELLTEDIERFRQLVEDLLEISRYDVDVNELDLERFLLHEFLRAITVQSGHEKLPIEFPDKTNQIIIEADKRRLARVINNLLQNATNYAGGATRLVVRKSGLDIAIMVEDAGPGIPEEERNTIFERFARGAEGGRRGSGTGTGLGLSLVTEHVRLHGGAVTVTGHRDGQPGSIFTVTLPEVVK